MYALAGKRVLVAGHAGMVGSALLRRLAREDCTIVTAPRASLDLRRQADVEAFMAATRTDCVVVAAARVGGILANDRHPVEFLHDNLMIAANVVAAAHACGVERLLFLGSSCIYPKHAAQPIAEAALLSGPLEPTNQWYALAKIAGVKLVEAYRRQHGRDYIAAMPTNLYGPGDNFDPLTSHVVPALIRKAHMAKVGCQASMTIWGSGTPRRDILHVDDCADALVLLLKTYSGEAPVNIGSGADIPIADLARLVSAAVGFRGSVVTDPTKPDGTPRKLLDTEKLRAMGWSPRIGLEAGLAQTYRWFLDHIAERNAA